MRITAEEMRQIHGDIGPIPECYRGQVEDPSPDRHAALVFFFVGVGVRR